MSQIYKLINMHDLILSIFNFLMLPTLFMPLILIGVLLINKQVFHNTLVLVTLSGIFNAILKCYWQIPLAVHLQNNWFAFPSGHTQFVIVAWGSLLIQRPTKWLATYILIMVPMGLYSIEYKGFHDWSEILGGIFSGAIVLSSFILMYKYRAQYLQDLINILSFVAVPVAILVSYYLYYLETNKDMSDMLFCSAICIASYPHINRKNNMRIMQKFAHLLVCMVAIYVALVLYKPIIYKELQTFILGLMCGFIIFPPSREKNVNL